MLPFKKQLEDALNEASIKDLTRKIKRTNARRKTSSKPIPPPKTIDKPQDISKLILPQEEREAIKKITIKLNSFLAHLVKIKPELREFAIKVNKALNQLYGKTKLPLSAQEFDTIMGEDLEDTTDKIAKAFWIGISHIINIIKKSKYNTPDQINDFSRAYQNILRMIESGLRSS